MKFVILNIETSAKDLRMLNIVKGQKRLFQVYSFCILVLFEYKENHVSKSRPEVSLHCRIYCLKSSLHDSLSVMYSCFVYAP